MPNIDDIYPPTFLTAGEVAQYIHQPHESLGAAIARFRNWEKTGLIKAAGKKHPGTGRKKRYSTDALMRAVILQTLTSALGAPAVSLAPSIGRLTDQFRRAQMNSRTNLAVISKRPGSLELKIDIVDQNKIGEYVLLSEFTVHTVINLTHIYETLMLDQNEIP